MKDLNLVKNLAWKFHRTTGIEWEELYGEGCLAYVLALKSYDSSKAKLSTWIYTCVYSRLNVFCKKQKHHLPLPESLIDYKTLPKEDYIKEPKTEITRTIRHMVMSAPEIYESLAPRRVRGLIKDQLRDMGWSWVQIWKGFKEMEEIYRRR